MNFWIINHYAVPPEFHSGTRHFDLAKGLIEIYNSKVLIIASNFSHFSFRYIINIDKKTSFRYIKKSFDNVDFIFFNVPSYKGNGIFRLFNMLFFSINIYVNALKIAKENFIPDVIIGSSVHPFAALSAYFITKRLKKIYKKEIKFIFEERDLWPQYLYHLPKSIKNPLKKIILIVFFKILYFIQQFLYKNSDKLIFLQKKGLENAKKYSNKSIYLFQIYRKIDYDTSNYIDQDFEEIRKNYKYLFCFVGAINNITYAIKELILAFKYLNYSTFGLVMFGGGDSLNEKLITIKENNIQNVFYLGFKRKELIRNYYLKKVDFLIIPCSFDLKIDFSSNKLIDYLEQKKPIIVIGYNLLDIINDIGFIIQDRDPKVIANKIKEIVNINPEILENKVNKGYEYLINELDYRVAAKKLYEFIKS